MYKLVNPPVESATPTKVEWKSYYQWFISSVDERVRCLSEAVRDTERFGEWRADFEPESLRALGASFRGQVESRPRTREEIAAVVARSPLGIGGDAGNELTTRTFSLAVDIGIYLGTVVIKHVPGTRWKHALGSPRSIDYGQPVVEGSGCAMNPVQLLITLAYAYAASEQTSDSLYEIYKIWSKQLVD